MKKQITIIFTCMLAVLLLIGCGEKKEETISYEGLLVTESTVESSRFQMKYEVSESFAILTDDLLQMAGDLTDDIQTGETVTINNTEYPLRAIAMVTDYEHGEYITFTIQKLAEGVTLDDRINELQADLDADITFSGLQQITMLGQQGYTFSMEQAYGESTYYNVGYMLQNENDLMTIMCSGTAFPVNTTESIVAQFAK